MKKLLIASIILISLWACEKEEVQTSTNNTNAVHIVTYKGSSSVKDFSFGYRDEYGKIGYGTANGSFEKKINCNAGYEAYIFTNAGDTTSSCSILVDGVVVASKNGTGKQECEYTVP